MNKILLICEKYLAALLVLILGFTLRIKITGEKPKERVIYVFWHRNMVPLLFSRKFEKIVIMISSSKDGELIAGPAKVLGCQTVRGSSTRGGTKALKEMIRLSKKYSLAITPDGPKGPAKEIKSGIISLAYLTKLAIIPVDVDIKSEYVFNSWDKFRFPKLFSKVNIYYGKAIYVNSKENMEDQKIILQKKMEEIEKTNKIK